MSGQKPWARHYQDVWEERSADHNLPQWLRVVSLAYGCHKANGHAMFGPGALAAALGKPDEQSGEMVPDPNPGRAVRVAVKYGWLDRRSTIRCLVVPQHAIAGGFGHPYAVCPMHGGRP